MGGGYASGAQYLARRTQKIFSAVRFGDGPGPVAGREPRHRYERSEGADGRSNNSFPAAVLAKPHSQYRGIRGDRVATRNLDRGTGAAVYSPS